MSKGMLIQSRLIRDGGTRANMGGTEYHFKPDPEKKISEHVCEVNNPQHIQAFLAITEGYKIHGTEDVVTQKEPEPGGDNPYEGDFDLADLESWDNKKLNLYAKTLGIDAVKSKKEISDVAVEQYDVELDENQSAPAMIRQLAEAIRGLDDQEA